MSRQNLVLLTAAALFAATLSVESAHAQAADTAKKKRDYSTKFFDSENPLDVTFITNIKRIRGDKGTNPPWRDASISFVGSDGKPIILPLKIRTRGIWRLKTCDFPPIRLDFPGKLSKGSLFEGLNKPKLVNYCRDDHQYEQYIVQELQLYRVYNILTPMSHRARLLRVTYEDSAAAKPMTTRYGIMLEEANALAARIGGQILHQEGAHSADLEPLHGLLVGVFQYFIANTDYSVNRLHNIELLARQADGMLVPIAYDFDFAGAVNTRYATADPQLGIQRVRERLFRGYCGSTEDYAPVFALFNQKKDAIYALYHDQIGQLLDKNVVDETLKYYDEFYSTINNARRAKDMLSNCGG